MEANKAHSLLDQFNDTIDTWISSLDKYTLEMLQQKPHPDTWSLGQVYVHIMDDTAYFVEQAGIALSNNNENSEKEMHADAKAIFRNKGFPDAMLNGPATNTSVRQPESKEELLQGLLSIKASVTQPGFADNLSRSKGKTTHPGLHFFSAAEWLQFAEMHMRHHFRQKKRIDEALFAGQ